MTNKEAIEILKELWRYEHTDRYSEKEIRISLELAIAALEKQTPMKPIIKEFDDIDERTGKAYSWKFNLCAACGEPIALKSYTSCHCGQIIDWSKDD